MVRDVIGLLAMARKWLSIHELAAITGAPIREVRDNGIAPIRDFLSEADGSFGFYHERFHAFVTRDLLFADESRHYHAALAKWLLSSHEHDTYRLSSIAHHLFEAGEHVRLTDVVTALFLGSKARRFGYAVLEDIELLTRSYLERDDVAAISEWVAIVKSLQASVDAALVDQATRAVRFPGARLHHAGSGVEPSLTSVPGIDLYAALLPRSGPSADFVATVPMGSRLAIVVGDAPGAGVKSAFIARLGANLFKRAVQEGKTLNDAIDDFEQGSVAEYFEHVALIAIVLALDHGIMSLVNRGLPAPVLYRASAAETDQLPVFGPTIGLNTGRRRMVAERHVEIAAGDIVILASDGLVETSRMDNPYGYRFVELLAARSKGSARAIGEAILSDWRAHSRPPEYSDDATILVAVMRRAS